jgi:3-oxoacyl-[acyl-carrier protein] reductase
VNAVAPGLIDTQMTQAIPQEVKDKFISKIPFKRIGKPEDIASIVAFLSSDEANYVTGQCIQVDGGLTTGSAGV